MEVHSKFELLCYYALDGQVVLADPAAAPGLRLRHRASGLVLDLLRLPVVPQALVWFNSPLRGHGGEAHAMEHVLLSKGKRGRAMASAESLLLAESTAFTCRTRTCYTFSTAAGQDTFFQVLGCAHYALNLCFVS